VPERVVTAIRAEQRTIEILVTFVQCAAIVTFATLYALAPKAFPPDVPFEPVPIALGIYAGFTLLRLWLALGRGLGPVFLVLSTIVDITLLMVTIWSFHLQYQAPPAISLKAPTLMYVFILIALRALSFEPRLVLVAGGTAITLWLGLVGWAAFGTDQTMAITRSFLVYTTSTQILLGAEFDKAVSMGMVTLILAVTLVRARRLLVRSVAEQQAAAELSRFFDPEVAARIRGTEGMLAPGFGEARAAAIMFVDLRGFTGLAATLDAPAVMRLLADYQDRVLVVVHRHGGSIDKFMGDGILASFGATLPGPTYAAQALAAAEDLVDAAAAWADERRAQGLAAPRINAALAAGEVLFGTVGNAMRLEYTVIGEPVNLAAKLEKHCKVERARLVVAGLAMDLAVRQGFVARHAWRARPAARVEGVGQPLALVVLEEG
jgi:adenylate cyclase